MKKLLVISGMIGILLFSPHPMYASESLPNLLVNAAPVPAVSPSPSVSPTPQLDDSSNANLVLTTVKSMFTSLDNFAGGFTFTTPNVFDSTVKLMDGAKIDQLVPIRIGFTIIGIMVGLGILAWKTMKSTVAIDASFLMKLLPRLGIYAISLILLPYLLSKSIDVINLFNQTILNVPIIHDTSLTSFVIDFYTKAQQQIASGKPASDFWISNATVFDLLHSIQNIVLLNLFFIITIIALLFGIVFLLMQCAMRFISILFLSLIYPLVIPFVLTEETEKTFTGFLRIWVTFILHQPAFCLGYVMIMYIIRSILSSNGATMGLLFLYIACLFFLGTVNILVARIFADATVALAANAEAGLANAMTGIAVARSFRAGTKTGGWIKNKYNEWKNKPRVVDHEFKKRAGGFTWEGQMWDVYPAYDRGIYPAGISEGGNHALKTGIIGGQDVIYGNPPAETVQSNQVRQGEQERNIKVEQRETIHAVQRRKSPYVQRIPQRGLIMDVIDEEKGIISVTGKGYAYTHPETKLKTIYLSHKDAKTDGVSPSQLQAFPFRKLKLDNISRFMTHNTSHERIKAFIETQERPYEKEQIQGVLSKYYNGANTYGIPRITLKGGTQ